MTGTRMSWKRIAVVMALGMLAGIAAEAQTVAARVAADAVTIDRVAEVSQRDLPVPLLKRIVEEDIELMRGPRRDGTYEHATWERFEASRIKNVFSIQPRSDRMQTVEMSGTNVYRVIIGVPGRRLLVRRNRPVWIERIDAEYVGEGSAQARQTSIPVEAWLQPGELRTVDLPVVSRQATVRIVATADAGSGYGNIDVALVQARIVDSNMSPYAAAMAQAKALPRALDDRNIDTIRILAQRMRSALPAGASELARSTASQIELQAELQVIDELLRGSDSQRLDGLERLQRLIRRVGP